MEKLSAGGRLEGLWEAEPRVEGEADIVGHQARASQTLAVAAWF